MSSRFQQKKKTAFLEAFPLCLPCTLPQKKAQFILIVVSPFLSNVMHVCNYFEVNSKAVYSMQSGSQGWVSLRLREHYCAPRNY